MEALRVVYHFPGRLRVRADALRTTPALARAVTDRVDAEDGVRSHRLSATTGSLLVEYDPHRIQLPALIEAILDAGHFTGVEVDASVDLPQLPQGARVRTALTRFNNQLQAVTRGSVDLRAAAPAALAGLGVATFVLGRRRLPEWYDLLFWSFVTFVNMNPPVPAVPEDDVPQA